MVVDTELAKIGFSMVSTAIEKVRSAPGPTGQASRPLPFQHPTTWEDMDITNLEGILDVAIESIEEVSGKFLSTDSRAMLRSADEFFDESLNVCNAWFKLHHFLTAVITRVFDGNVPDVGVLQSMETAFFPSGFPQGKAPEEFIEYLKDLLADVSQRILLYIRDTLFIYVDASGLCTEGLRHQRIHRPRTPYDEPVQFIPGKHLSQSSRAILDKHDLILSHIAKAAYCTFDVVTMVAPHFVLRSLADDVEMLDMLATFAFRNQ